MTASQDSAVARARALATAAHRGQVDKAGDDYITHPARVAAAVAGDPDAQIVAWLHDVVEDTAVTAEDLAAEFAPHIVAAVLALTRRSGETADAYYARVRADRLALRVKLADIGDNADPSRLAALDRPTRARLTEKYAFARAALVADQT